ASNFEGNRFAIFDNRIIFIGTYNWTYAGEAVYSNNCLVLDDITIVDKYVHRFGFLWEIYEK
nr:hypothetical protein [Rickettsiales bacterium]